MEPLWHKSQVDHIIPCKDNKEKIHRQYCIHLPLYLDVFCKAASVALKQQKCIFAYDDDEGNPEFIMHGN